MLEGTDGFIFHGEPCNTHTEGRSFRPHITSVRARVDSENSEGPKGQVLVGSGLVSVYNREWCSFLYHVLVRTETMNFWLTRFGGSRCTRAHREAPIRCSDLRDRRVRYLMI